MTHSSLVAESLARAGTAKSRDNKILIKNRVRVMVSPPDDESPSRIREPSSLLNKVDEPFGLVIWI
jgi:hypothetical protein